MKERMPAAFYTIAEAATAARCTPAEIRVWGDRYGWPMPRRSPAGYRLFDQHLVNQLRRVVMIRDGGKPIGEILANGVPNLPDEYRRCGPVDLGDLRMPTHGEARELAQDLVAAFGKGLTPADIRRRAELGLPRVHPRDRGDILAIVDRIAQTDQAGAA
jgi:hypothetical protein